MFSLAGLTPAIANAVYIDLRDNVRWLFEDMSEDMRARRQHALASLADLHPATSLEARLAVQVVANDIHATDCFRAAAEHRDDEKKLRHDRAQGNALQRHSYRAMHKLEQLQKDRWKDEAQRALDAVRPQMTDMPMPTWLQAIIPPESPDPRPAASDQHLTASDLRAGPSAFPPSGDTPPAAAPGPRLDSEPAISPAVPAASGQVPPAAAPADEQQQLPDQPVADAAAAPMPAGRPRRFSAAALARAESFAARKPAVALRIRHAGRLTRAAINGFRPEPCLHDAAVIDALVHGTSPALMALDAMGHAPRQAA